MLFLRVCIPTLYPYLLFVEPLKHIGYLFLILFAIPKTDFAKVCISLTASEIYMGLMQCCLWGGPVPSCDPSLTFPCLHPSVRHPMALPRSALLCHTVPLYHSSASPGCAGIIDISSITGRIPACYYSLYKRYGYVQR